MARAVLPRAYSTTTVTSNSIHPIGVTHCCVVPHVSRDVVIAAVPRVRATKVRGGSVQGLPGGRHTMAMGETPGARIAGLVDIGVEGQGNRAAMTSVPTATWIVVPFCAGVIVIVPWVVPGEVLGLDRGDGGGEAGRDGDGDGRAEEDEGAGGVGGADEVGPPAAELLGGLESGVVVEPVPAP